MRPSLNILEPRAHRPDRRRGDARAGRGRDGDPRARRCAGGCSTTGCRSMRPGRAGPVPARRGRGGHRLRAGLVRGCTTATGPPHADIGGDRVHFVPGSSGLKVLDHRTGETRLANSTDFVEYVRLADGLGQHPVPRHGLLDQRRHRGRRVGRLAPVHDPDQLEEAGRVGRLHRARRPADGRDDAAVPGGPGRPRSPARCRSSRSPRPATSGTARTPART